jgi:hypothetical protein
MRTVAGPSSVVQWVLSGGPYTVEGALQAARAFVFDALGQVWDAALSGDVSSDEQRARFLLANQHAMRAAIDALATATGFGGMAALRPDHPLQRCLRDIHAATSTSTSPRQPTSVTPRPAWRSSKRRSGSKAGTSALKGG